MPEGNAPVDSDAPVGGKRARRTADLSRRLLDAAVAEFSERGYEAAKISEIARRSGLSTGAIYTRWRDKRECFLGAVSHAVSQRLADGSSNDSPLGQLAASLGASHLTSDDDARALFLEALVIARRDSAMRANIAEAFDNEADALTRLVTAGKAAGILDESLSTQLVVLCCQALSIGMQLALSMSEDRISDDDTDQWDELVRRVVNSWAPPEAARELDG